MKLLLTLLCMTSTFGCAHKSYYTAEIDGPGVKADVKTHVGAIYSIPPASAQLKMKVVSLGVTKDPQKNTVLRMRIYFARKNVAAGTPGSKGNNILEFIDPKEQSVVLSGDNTPIHPSRIFGNPKSKPMIELLPNQKQVVELYFPMPAKIKSDDEVQSFTFSWKVHYSSLKSEQQITRFDRQDTAPMNNAEFVGDPDYPNFPINEYAVFPADFEWAPMMGPFWWW